MVHNVALVTHLQGKKMESLLESLTGNNNYCTSLLVVGKSELY